MLTIGQKAPDFEGINQNEKVISLADFKGKKLLLYFYPKDNTPGCTAESCNLNDNYSYWQKKGYEIIGVSPDSIASHKKFTEKYGLQFHLLADTQKEILLAYDAWGEKKNYGKTYMGVLRTTYIIDENGLIEAVFKKVDTKNHTEQINKQLEATYI